MIAVLPDSGYDRTMSQGTDLYTIIRFYANRSHVPEIPVDTFISFLEKYAKRYASERPDLGQWATDTSRKVWAELPRLAEANTIRLVTDEGGTKIAVDQYYVDLLQQAYRSADDSAELPFPDEVSLKIIVPPVLLKTVNMEMDLSTYIASPPESPLPILKLVLPEGTGSPLILSSMISKRLLELSLLKIRHYLRSHNNKEYVQHKLAPAFQGKESQLKEKLNQLLIRPFDALGDIENAGDFSFSFWAYMTSLVKGDIKKKNDRLPEDMAALQAFMILEVYNNYYKSKATRAKEAETAFKNLELALEKAPFLFTVDDIIRFTDTKGVPLLGQYTQQALEEYLKTKSTTSVNEQLPELLIVRGPKDERWFLKKSKMLPLCVRLLGEARPRIKSAITQRWFKVMSNFQSEAAMENDDAFEKELAELADIQAPSLMALLDDQKLYLVYKELEGTEGGIPEAARLFYKGNLAPLADLLLLKRKDILVDVRMLLPFWYSMPIVSKIIAFFKNFGKKEKKSPLTKNSAPKKGPAENLEELPSEEGPTSGKVDRRKELAVAAKKAQGRLLPPGYTVDRYLGETQDRWNRLINAEAKNNLTEDVNSLIRDYLRRTIRSLRSAPFTEERIAALADTLVETPILQKLPAKESLRIYIQLYITKLLLK